MGELLAFRSCFSFHLCCPHTSLTHSHASSRSFSLHPGCLSSATHFRKILIVLNTCNQAGARCRYHPHDRDHRRCLFALMLLTILPWSYRRRASVSLSSSSAITSNLSEICLGVSCGRGHLCSYMPPRSSQIPPSFPGLWSCSAACQGGAAVRACGRLC